MNKLLQEIQTLQTKLESYHRRSLNEYSTRTIIIEPLLETLRWDIRDLDEVKLEYPTVDGKFVDYALMINGKPILLVEAKPLDDALNDVKAITQVVGYAANDGIAWCILTNGVKWKVYSSVEKCPAPEKLMFEISLDPRESEGLTVEQMAHQMWRFSRDGMAGGTLDALGEQTFTDGKVRKALDSIMREPPRAFLNLVKASVGDGNLRPQKVKESLSRIWAEYQREAIPKSEPPPIRQQSAADHPSRRSEGARKAWDTRRVRSPVSYEESSLIAGKPAEVVELYRAIDRFCLSLGQEAVEKRPKAKYITYRCGKHVFCCTHIKQSGIRIWLKLKYGRLEHPPTFARDVSNIGHWGVGDLELDINNLNQLDTTKMLILQSFKTGG